MNKKQLRGVIFTLLGVTSQLWGQLTYQFEIELNSEAETMLVSQTIEFTNNSNEALATLYLYDWANSYRGAPSPLANHLANEFNRSFYITADSRLGATQINTIKASTLREWSRLTEQLDILKVELNEALQPNAKLVLALNYQVKIPDDKFTGIGINSAKRIFLRDLFITVAPRYDNAWLLNSNLGFRDYSSIPGSYTFNWTYPSEYNLISNLTELSTVLTGELKTTVLADQQTLAPEFVFDLKNEFETLVISEDFSIVTDILPSKNAEVNFESSLKKIDRFTKTILTELPTKKLLVLQKDYAKNPIVGIGQAPSFLNPFSDDFVYETRFIKAYLASYLNELLVINKRKDHWITGGIQTYVMMKFVEAFYPGSKFLGDLNKIKILGLTLFKPYSAAQIGFNESFSFMAEFTEHANNQQEDILSKDQLTKSNESYAIPYHTGSGLYYLDKYLGDQILEESIKEFSIERGSRSLKEVIAAHTPKETQWFFDTYLTDREAFDLSIKNVIKAPNAIRFTVSEKNAKSLPYKLDLIKDNEIIKEEWIFHSGKDSILELNPGEADFIALNSNRFLPEKNRPNNWKYLQSASGLKPLRLTFYGDSEDLKRNQLFYHPISDFNAYDGFTAGMRIYNTRLKNQPFEIDFHPQYSIKENALVGFFRTRYRFMNHDSKNYQNQVFITGRSYHYNTNLRYTSLQPSFSMYFRPLDLRSNKRQFFNISWYNVFRDRDPEIQVTPDYSVLSMLHRYNNSDAVDVFTTNSNLEISNKFGKIYFSTNYRKLYPSGRQFSLRFFAGKFLWHNTTETQFFDFNLNRSPDYLFRYDYLGRSEDTGIYSQQFVPAEGGFKSFFNESSANDYMASINGSIGIWKWIEFYGDVGILRNQNRPAVTYFDSGIKLSLVPDYFELFFPLYSSNGFDLTQPGYDTKIRFIFTPRLSTLSSLFTRKWF